jgi:hypothetical protein
MSASSTNRAVLMLIFAATSAPLGCGSRTGVLVTAPQDAGATIAPDGGAVILDSGNVADGGTNAEAGMPNTPCPGGESLCNGACVNEQTDPSNCGGCDRPCSQPCEAGQCLTTIASHQAEPWFVAVNATHIAWTSFPDVHVATVPKTGGAPHAIADQAGRLSGIALDATNAYWQAGDLMTAPVSGGPATMLASLGSWQMDMVAVSIAADQTSVYWSDSGNRALMRMSRTGGAPTTLADHVATALAVDSTSVYFTTPYDIDRVPIGGGPTSTLASGVTGSAIAVNSTNLYFVQWTQVLKVPLMGGAVSTLASQATSPTCQPCTPQPGTIAADDANVYWTGGDDGQSVVRMPAAGGEMVTIAAGQAAPAGIALDDTSVYWANAAGGTVMRLTPK